jgi:oligosaccharide repeat unit polymerase
MYQFENILISLIFIFAHFCLFFVNYTLANRKLLHPAVLFSLIWFIIIVAHLIFSFTILDELPPLNTSTYVIFLVGVICFSFGSHIQTYYWYKTDNVNTKSTYIPLKNLNSNNLYLRYFLLFISVTGLPFFLYVAYKIFLLSDIDNLLMGLRTELIYGDQDFGILKYLFAFSLVTFAFNLQAYLNEKNRINLILTVTSFLSSLVYAIFTTGRLPFLLILAVFIGVRFISDNKSFSIRKIFIASAIFMISFILLGVVYSKGGNSEESSNENVRLATQGTAIYMVASLNALDLVLHDQFQVDYNGNYSLRFFIKLGKVLNISRNSKVHDLITPFVLVPYPTNVYTVYHPYIKDFGRLYAWILMGLFGLIHSYFYNKALKQKDFRSSFWYSILLFPLLVSFFADQYFSLISFWIQFIIIVELIIFLNKILNSKTREIKYIKGAS